MSVTVQASYAYKGYMLFAAMYKICFDLYDMLGFKDSFMDTLCSRSVAHCSLKTKFSHASNSNSCIIV